MEPISKRPLERLLVVLLVVLVVIGVAGVLIWYVHDYVLKPAGSGGVAQSISSVNRTKSTIDSKLESGLRDYFTEIGRVDNRLDDFLSCGKDFKRYILGKPTATEIGMLRMKYPSYDDGTIHEMATTEAYAYPRQKNTAEKAFIGDCYYGEAYKLNSAIVPQERQIEECHLIRLKELKLLSDAYKALQSSFLTGEGYNIEIYAGEELGVKGTNWTPTHLTETFVYNSREANDLRMSYARCVLRIASMCSMDDEFKKVFPREAGLLGMY